MLSTEPAPTPIREPIATLICERGYAIETPAKALPKFLSNHFKFILPKPLFFQALYTCYNIFFYFLSTLHENPFLQSFPH